VSFYSRLRARFFCRWCGKVKLPRGRYCSADCETRGRAAEIAGEEQLADSLDRASAWADED
jgi:hypothetical protein